MPLVDCWVGNNENDVTYIKTVNWRRSLVYKLFCGNFHVCSYKLPILTNTLTELTNLYLSASLFPYAWPASTNVTYLYVHTRPLPPAGDSDQEKRNNLFQITFVKMRVHWFWICCANTEFEFRICRRQCFRRKMNRFFVFSLSRYFAIVSWLVLTGTNFNFGVNISIRSRKPRLTTVGIRCADHAKPSISRSWH
jgi:hypothetical protein